MSAYRVTISGRVQRVGYRDWLVREARAMGVDGWVRNRRDGTVEALLSGEVDVVAELLRACRRGPPRAEVTEITESLAEPPDEPGFQRLPTD